MDQFQLLDWLQECDGDEIWTREYSLSRGLPVYLVDALIDAYESGFESSDQTIYYEERQVLQFEGVRDVDIAIWIGKQLKVNTRRILDRCLTRKSVVQAIKDEYEEG